MDEGSITETQDTAEVGWHNHWRPHRERRAGASPKYFEFYNRCRPHSSVDRMAPEQF